MEIPRTEGGETRASREAGVEQEGRKTPKEMRNELLLCLHPDIDGLIHEAEKLAERNQAVRQVIEAYKQAEATGDDTELRQLYQTHVLDGREAEQAQTAERKRDLLQEARDLQSRLSVYLLGTDDEFQEMTEKFNSFWDDLEEEWQKQLGLMHGIHTALCRLRAVLASVAREKQWSETEHRAEAKQSTEGLEAGLGAAIKKMEEEKVDPVAITQTLLQFQQQILVHTQALSKQTTEEAAAAKKKTKEEAEAEREREEFADSDDDLEDETATTTAPRLQAIAPAAIEEEETTTPIAPVILLAMAGATLEQDKDGDMLVHTKDVAHIHHLEIMTHKQFLDGYADGKDGAGHRFRITRQILPWCAAPKEEFFTLNHRHEDLFPHAFRRLKRPGMDEYFPEAVFLDNTGAALKAYLGDSWRGYLQSAEYQDYLAKYEPDQSRVLTV